MIQHSIPLGPVGAGDLDQNLTQILAPELHSLPYQGKVNPTDMGNPYPQVENRDVSIEAINGNQNVVSMPTNETQGGGRQQFCEGSIDLNSRTKEVVANVELRNQFDALTRRVRPRSSVEPLQSTSVSQSASSM